MASNPIDLLILCEDLQQSCFVRRFLIDQGWDKRKIRLKVSPSGRGSGAAFVINNFHDELHAHRNRSHRVSNALVVVLDADTFSVVERENQLRAKCSPAIPFRNSAERVLLLIPRRNIETWFAFLEGKTPIDETISYPKYSCESDCFPVVRQLSQICRQHSLPSDCPPSLIHACNEYKKL